MKDVVIGGFLFLGGILLGNFALLASSMVFFCAGLLVGVAGLAILLRELFTNRDDS